MIGYIKLHRQIFENDLYFDEPFTKTQAWIDILLITSHKPQTFFVRGVEVKVDRGQFAYAERTLAERWKWSRGKVRNFLNWLETRQQIVQKKAQTLSIYTVLNYDRYQGFDEEEKPTEKAKTVPQTVPQKAQYNNDKNDKEYIDTNVSIGATPKKDMRNSEIELILKTFEKRTGQIPSDKNPRFFAQHIRIMLTTFVRHNREEYLRTRKMELTPEYVLDKAWDWFFLKKYAGDVEKLETFKLKLRVFLASQEKKLQEGRLHDEERGITPTGNSYPA